MGFIKLQNCKTGKFVTPPEGVAVQCRKLNGRKAKASSSPSTVTRFALLRIGPSIARRAGFTMAQHRAHILIGDGLERNRCGISIDDKGGAFQFKRQKSGDYQMSLGARTCAGLLNLDVPAFTATAELVPVGPGQPPSILFDLGNGMRLQ